MSKSLCIIGAGPSGLVAAKTLLHDAPNDFFDVTLFDSQGRTGGLWPNHWTDGSGLVHPLMLANQSRHTMHFSDFAWPEDSPEIPRAWQVGRYLANYREKYCGKAKFHLGAKVETAKPMPASHDPKVGEKWCVKVRAQDGSCQTYEFDYLLVASGYFGKPHLPFPLPVRSEVPVIHSSQYRDLSSLLGCERGSGRTILVVGGQMSGIEIAGTIATHLSSVVNSANPSSIPNADQMSIRHIAHRKAWVLPLYTPTTPTFPAPTFTPLDLTFYNLNNREKPLTNMQGSISPEAAQVAHSVYCTLLGSDQSIYSPEVAIAGSATIMQPPYLGISDTYLEFVRSGLIKVTAGKLGSLAGSVAILAGSGEQITGVAAVVLATGFDASQSLSFFPSSVQDVLAVSPEHHSNTVALAFHGTHHPAFHNLGFVGFYRSPYWGVMEMQARYLTTLWASGGPSSPSLPISMRVSLEKDDSVERTLSLRHDPRASQFPMGDYPWLMQKFAAALGMERSPSHAADPALSAPFHPVDVLTPASYPPRAMSPSQQVEVEKSRTSVLATLTAALKKGKFVAGAAFRSLLGDWRLERDVTSRLPSYPSGHFSGTARFLIRQSTIGQGDVDHDDATKPRDKLDREGLEMDTEYLYIEDGEFRGHNGICFPATRRYIWRYDGQRDKISVWFVKTNDQKRADYLFHELNFVPQVNGRDSATASWVATASHLCVDDCYEVKYHFAFQAVNVASWAVRYGVRGPYKDYDIQNTYWR